MKKGFKRVMWIILSLGGLIAAIAVILLNWQTITNFKIGRTMNDYTETTTHWTNIDFTTTIKGETPYIGAYDNKPYSAIEKYRINGIFGIKNVVLLYGSNVEEVESKWDADTEPYDVIYKNEEAYIFRSTDDGKTFEKICLGHGAAGYDKNAPIFVNNVLYIGVEEGDTQKIHYYRSEDLGNTWQKNNWKPTSVWKDGTLFIGESKSSQDGVNVQMSKDDGKTWHHIDGELKSFHDKTHSLWQLNDHTIVGMTEEKKVLFLDLTTMQEKNYPLSVPKGKVIGEFGTNSVDSKNEFYLKLYDDVKDPNDEYAYIKTQESIWFPMSDEHIEITKKIPKIFFNISQNYIGGIFKYGDETWGTPVHVYTLDRGKHWKFEILEPYRLILTSAYINGQFWFIANKNPNADMYLTKGKVE